MKLLNYTLSVTLTSTVLTAAAPLVATFVDGVFVGNLLGADAFNAINVIMPIQNLVTVLTLICSMGGSVLAAKALAFRNIMHAQKIFTISMLSSFLVAIACIALLFGFMDSLASFVCSDAASIPYFKDYLTMLLFYFLFVPLNSTLNNFISQEGFPDLTTKIVLISNIVNIMLDVVFICLMDMGVKGAALATVISGIINTVAYLPHFLRKRSRYKFMVLSASDLSILKESLVQGVAFNVFYIMVNGLIFFANKLIFGALGSMGMQIYGICLQIQSFTFCLTVGTSIAGIAQVNRFMAEAVNNKAAYVINRLILFITLCHIGIILIMTLFPAVVASAFGISDPAVLDTCRIPFFCFSLFYLCFAIMAVYSTISFQLMGHVTAKFVFIFGLGIVVYAFMSLFSHISPEMLWWGFPVGGFTMLGLSFAFGYVNHLRNASLTKFTLVETMPSEIIMEYSLDYECKNLPKLIDQLHVFTKLCELPDYVFKGIELCCTEYCDYLRESKIPLLARTFDVIIRQLPDGICMIIESAGAPNSVIISNEKMESMKANLSDLSQSEIRQMMLSTIPQNIEYRYMFDLNVTTMTWKI